MNMLFFNSVILLFIPYFGQEPDIKGRLFFTDMLLNREQYGYSSVCSFDEKSYIIQTIDNSHGQWETKVTEEGAYKVRGRKLTMQPKTRLVCPKLIREWGFKGEKAYTDELKTDSVYLPIYLCNEFSEYTYVNRDTLSKEKRDKLRFVSRSYEISQTDHEVILKCSKNCERDYLHYPIIDYGYFRSWRH